MANLKESLAHVPFEKLLQIQEKLGTKVYQQHQKQQQKAHVSTGSRRDSTALVEQQGKRKAALADVADPPPARKKQAKRANKNRYVRKGSTPLVFFI